MAIILLHIPRLYIEYKSNTLATAVGDFHGEDNYQKSRDQTTKRSNRLFGWTFFKMDEKEWELYVKDIEMKLLKLYRKEFDKLLSNISDGELVSIRTTSDVNSYLSHGNVVSTWIDNEMHVIRTCFNHSWCSGFFFLQYAAVIFRGDAPKPATFPNVPFIPELYCLKMLLKKPHLPISKCFSTNIEPADIRRIGYKIDLSNKSTNVPSRTYILWNIMFTLSHIENKDYNILIPIPFKKLHNVWNNIGVIFVKWPKNGMTLKELDDEINKNKYNAVATNLFLRGLTNSSQGSNSRKNVDLVFTTGYVKNAEIEPLHHAATFNGVADYGIYCLTGSFKNNITHVSLTFSTMMFDFDKLVKLLNNENIPYRLF